MMKFLVIVFLLIVLFSGCIEQKPVHGTEGTTPVITVTAVSPVATPVPDVPIATSTPAITEKPKTDYDRFVSWLKEDATNKHPYILDNSKIYEELYVCSHFTRDFMKNASNAGFEVYAVKLTGAVKGQDAWHMLAAVILDDRLYFVDPQTDKILKKEDMLKAYGYEYAYFGREVYINRNEADISAPVHSNQVIGLNGQDYLYLRQ
ncbi:Uncharacterised protein [uncultured archaeon]|nr:Uncharacterised protein [uncultured archaeon]